MRRIETCRGAKRDSLFRSATEAFRAAIKKITKVIPGHSDEVGGCKNASEEDLRSAWRVERNTAGKGRQQRILKRSDLPWPSEF